MTLLVVPVMHGMVLSRRTRGRLPDTTAASSEEI